MQQQLLVLLKLSLFFRIVSFLQECHGGAEAWACGDEDEEHVHGKEWILHLQQEKLLRPQIFGRHGWFQEKDEAGGQQAIF